MLEVDLTLSFLLFYTEYKMSNTIGLFDLYIGDLFSLNVLDVKDNLLYPINTLKNTAPLIGNF